MATQNIGASPRGQGPVAIDTATPWVTTDDYPAEALAQHAEGRVKIRLAIDTAGHVTDCTVTLSSEVPVLDDATCRLVRARATFRPAIDDQGRPVASTIAHTFRWQLPKDVPVEDEASRTPWRPNVTVMRFGISADGKIEKCSGRTISTASSESEECNAEVLHFFNNPEVHSVMTKNIRGTGVRGTLIMMLRLNIPGMRRAPQVANVPKPYTTQLKMLTIDATGNVSDCSFKSASGVLMYCSPMDWHFEPAPGVAARHADLLTTWSFQPAR